MEKKTLEKVRELAVTSESIRVRRACVSILTDGFAVVEDRVGNGTAENRELWETLEGAGCDFVYGYEREGFYRVTCDGAKCCYTTADYYE